MMICKFCGARVEWKGPLTELTYTQCTNCGRQNCQETEDQQAEGGQDEAA